MANEPQIRGRLDYEYGCEDALTLARELAKLLHALNDHTPVGFMFPVDPHIVEGVIVKLRGHIKAFEEGEED